MPSSISSSEMDTVARQRGQRALWCVLAVLLLVAMVLEAIGLAFSHVSRIQNRIVTDYRNAVKLPTSADGKPTLLLVGNSLALEGIDFPEFQKDTANDYRASRFIVEQTSYLDWYYGLRRLFHAGARPNMVVLCLSTQDFVVEGVRWGYFAHFLMDLRDFPSVVRKEDLGPTSASNYLFAHLSAWLGTKTEIRNWLLVKTLPDIVKFGNLFPDLPPVPPVAVVRSVAKVRFRELQEITAPYGTRLVLLVPPNLKTSDPVNEIEDAGRKAGTTVLVPFRPGEMKPQCFRDGFHLNDDGSQLFTPRLASQLHELHAGALTRY